MLQAFSSCLIIQKKNIVKHSLVVLELNQKYLVSFFVLKFMYFHCQNLNANEEKKYKNCCFLYIIYERIRKYEIMRTECGIKIEKER